MIKHGLVYGLLSTRRRMGALLLPVVTTATGAYLVVQVLALGGAVQHQADTLGNAGEMHRAVLLIAVVVLLVGVVEVAVCTTRTIAHRTREIGVLGATGVRRAPVVAALLVEPLVSSVVGAVLGAAVAVVSTVVLSSTGLTSTEMSARGAVAGVVLAVLVSAVAALVTSAVPSWRACSRPPIHSLSSGG
jgi:ABC-type antimicrobial peptide transport system permease subunit